MTLRPNGSFAAARMGLGYYLRTEKSKGKVLSPRDELGSVHLNAVDLSVLDFYNHYKAKPAKE